MTWAQFASNWNFNLSALMRRFPHASEQDLARARIGPSALTRVIARSHDLTEPEAREELDRFLGVQTLARAALDMRSYDEGFVSMK